MNEATLIHAYRYPDWPGPLTIPIPGEPCVGPECGTLLARGDPRVLCQFCARKARRWGSVIAYATARRRAR